MMQTFLIRNNVKVEVETFYTELFNEYDIVIGRNSNFRPPEIHIVGTDRDRVMRGAIAAALAMGYEVVE